jgi:protein CpxP
MTGCYVRQTQTDEHPSAEPLEPNMSDTESRSSTSSQPSALSAESQSKPRWRRILFATVLVIGGGVIGALIASPSNVLGQYGGWHGGPYGGSPGDHGWSYGPHHGAMADFAGRLFMPGPVERATDRVLWSVDASREQRDKVNAIIHRTVDELFALREKHVEGRKQLRDALAASTIDRGKIESIRTEQMQLADLASKRITDALAQAAEVLTPPQRAELARRLEARMRWFRG